MKFTKRLLTIALSMSMVMPLCATAYAAKTVTINSATIKANATDSSLYDVTVTFSVADSSKQMSLLLTGPNADNKLDDNDIVHINQFGKNEPDEAVIVSGSGTCTFSVTKARIAAAGATVDESAGTTTMSVIMGADDATEAADPEPVTYVTSGTETVAVTGVELGDTSINLTEGNTQTLVAVVKPADATNQNVTWSSSDETVATVENGVVKALKKGTTTITVTTEDEGFTATCEVTVNEESDELLGDIDGNKTVDIDDAILLFQHSVFPDVYQIEYKGNIDFDKSGTVDIDDAILLFQYSVFPDIYPIG